MDAQSRWILIALVALGAVLVAGSAWASADAPFPQYVTGSSEFVEVVTAHDQQRNLTLVIAEAARDGADGALPTLIVPADLDALDTYEPDSFEGTPRKAIALWLLRRMTAGNVEFAQYSPLVIPDVVDAPDEVTYPLGVSRIGTGERFLLYRVGEPGTIVLVEESLIGGGDAP